MVSSHNLIVAYVHRGYPECRNILYANCATVGHVQLKDIFKILTYLSFKLFNKLHPLLQNIFFSPARGKYDVLHLFNGINLGSTLWVVTFETRLPRLGNVPRWVDRIAVNKLANPSCIGIIAISDCAKKIQCEFLKAEFPKLSEVICKKIFVLHPPQPVLLDTIKSKPDYQDKIIFIFVGNQFFSKGGREILKLFLSTEKRNRKVELHIISALEPDSYASNTTQHDVNNLKAQLAELPEHIVYHGVLPNEKVLDLLKQSHVALLPTYADTYGYFLLEAQACGCPVISTDIRALTEINSMDCGWLISVPKDAHGNGKLNTDYEREIFSQCVYRGLEKYILDILDNPWLINIKALTAIKRISEKHDPVKHTEILKTLYLKSLVH